MTDIAELGIKVSADGIDSANASLNALAVNSGQATKAAEGLEKAQRGVSAATSTAAQSLVEEEIILRRNSGALTSVKGSLNNYIVHTNRAGDSTKVASHHMTNMVYQLNDIAVTASMGMSPLQILMQQGSQIGQIFATSGSSAKAWAGAMGLLNPMLWVTVAVFGALGASVKLATDGMNDSFKSVDHQSKITGAQLDWLKEKGVNTAITMGDAFNGYVKTLQDAAENAFKPELEQMAKWWSETHKDMSKKSYSFWNYNIAGWAGMIAATGAFIDNLGLAWQKFLDWSGNGIKSWAEQIVGTYNKALNAIDRARITNMSSPEFKAEMNANIAGRSENPFFGRSYHPQPFKSAVDTGRAAAQKALDNIPNNILDARDLRLENALKDKKWKEPKEKKAKEPANDNDVVTVKAYVAEWNNFYNKSKQALDEYRKSVELLKSTENMTNQERTKAITLQGYINEIDKNNIEPKAKLVALEKELASAKDDKQIAKIKDEIDATKSKIIELTDERKAKLELLAIDKARLEQEEKIQNFYKNTKDGLNEQSRDLQAQAAALFMTSDAADLYLAKQNMINQAIREGIDPTTNFEAKLKDLSNQYADNQSLQKLIDKTREWKDTFKSAFSDLIRGGASFKEVLGQIANKMLEMATNDLFDKLWGSMKGNGSSKDGGWISTAINFASSLFTKNANGGVYNSQSLSGYSGGVYNSPQVFAFAKGAGVFAEAGPEAIMPLKRGKDGKLGVAASGNAEQGSQIIQLHSYIGSEKIDERIIQISSGVATDITKTAFKTASKAQSRQAIYGRLG